MAALAAATERVDDRAARGVPRVPSARPGRAHGGGDRRDQRRALRARRRLGLERGGVPRVRPAVRLPRSRFIESFEIIRRLLAGERVTSEGRFWQVRRRRPAATAGTHDPDHDRRERAEAARRDAAPRRQLEHVVRRLRQHAPRASSPATPRSARPPSAAGAIPRRSSAAPASSSRSARGPASGRTATTRRRSRAPRARSHRPCATSPRPAPTRRSSCSIRSPRRACGSAPAVLAALDA